MKFLFGLVLYYDAKLNLNEVHLYNNIPTHIKHE